MLRRSQKRYGLLEVNALYGIRFVRIYRHERKDI